MSKEGINRTSMIDNAERLGFPVYSGDEMKSFLLKGSFINVNYERILERERDRSVWLGIYQIDFLNGEQIICQVLVMNCELNL